MNGIILAGGKSKRLGTDKTVVEVGGKRLTEIVLENVSSVVDDIVIVTNSPQLFANLPARLTTDVMPGAGSLGGILSGLLASQQEQNLVVAADMPFLNAALLRYLCDQAKGFDIVMARSDGFLEPLHAIFSKGCVAPIRAMLAKGNYKIIELLREVRVRYVEQEEVDRFDPSHLSFFNINTPADLQFAREEFERRRAQASAL